VNDWVVLRSEPGAAAWNMALDEALLESAQEIGRPVLRFYSWKEPAATFGYSQRFQEIAAWTKLRPLIRRITGGGLVPHDADWTYTLIFPPSHPWYALRADESYRRLHEWVAAAFAAMEVAAQLSPCCEKPAPGQCFVGAEKFDVLAGGRKIAGAAQKRNKLGLLIQGSAQPGAQSLSRARWEEAMLAQENRPWTEFKLSVELLNRAQVLADEKYSRAEHNERR
jgi:lipoyl(octanoyl) transferase